MTLDAILTQLDDVRSRGTGKWSARCPAHADKSPSLSIAEGERGVLLHCWAGCTAEEITAALGIELKDLFADERPDPQAMHQRERARQRRRHQQDVDGLTIDSIREAEQYIQSRRGLDISTWTDQRLDAEVDALAEAYGIMGDRHDHE